MCGAQAEDKPSWWTCGSQDCTGIPLPGEEFCLAHVEDTGRAAFLAGLKPGSDLDLRGTPIRPDHIFAVFEAVKEDQTPKLRNVRFEGAQFGGYAGFNGAQFSGDAWFDGAQFSRGVGFEGAQFGGNAGFRGAQFSGDAVFGGAQFRGDALFRGAEFSGRALFRRAEFNRDAGFDRAEFREDARFEGAQFSGEAGFGGAQFGGFAGFEGAQFSGEAGFDGAQFSEARVLGPLIVERQLSLRQASFSAPILIEVATSQLSLIGVAFQEAASLRVRCAEIALDGTSFTKPSTISFAETTFQTSGSQLEDHALETGNRVARPRLLSVRLVDVSNLVLGNLDLSACLFQGAHNLEKLRIEGPLRFGQTPRAWRVRLGRWWLPIWRPWIRRQALAEEHHFRAQQSSSPVGEVAGRLWTPGWSPLREQEADWLGGTTGQQVQTVSQENLAALYRALRKGLEDQRNAPGAADFYYGEMEMRRHSRMSPWTDRFVVWIYWLFSGYGLRASRALVAFALLVPLFAIGFWLWGLDPDHGHRISYSIALLRSFESATSLLRPAPAGLNEIGQLLDAVLRLIGATLLGLALFSLRGRIKR